MQILHKSDANPTQIRCESDANPLHILPTEEQRRLCPCCSFGSSLSRFVPDHRSLKPSPALGIKNGSSKLVGSTVPWQPFKSLKPSPALGIKNGSSKLAGSTVPWQPFKSPRFNERWPVFMTHGCFSERYALRRGQPKRCEANRCALTHLFSPGVDSVRR